MSLRSTPEIPSSGLQVCSAHHIVAILELGAWLQASLLHLLLLLCAHHHHATLVHSIAKNRSLRLIVPLDLELGNSGLLDQDVTNEAVNKRLLRRVLSKLGLLVIVVHIVAYSEELLVGVGAGHQNASHTDNL